MSALPSNAERKLRELSQSANDAEALLASTQATLRSLLAEQNNPQTTAARRAELRKEIAEAEEKRDHRAKRRNNGKQMVLQCHRFINSLPRGSELQNIERLDARYNDVSDLKEGVEEIRAKINALRKELREVKAAPLPLADLRAQAKEYVDRLAQEGRPVMKGVCPVFPVPRAEYENDQTAERFLRFQAWTDPDKLLSALVREIEQEASDAPDAMSAADKKARADALAAELFEHERDEEAFVTEALERGLDVERRVHADPRAVLSVVVVSRKKKAA